MGNRTVDQADRHAAMPQTMHAPVAVDEHRMGVAGLDEVHPAGRAVERQRHVQLAADVHALLDEQALALGQQHDRRHARRGLRRLLRSV